MERTAGSTSSTDGSRAPSDAAERVSVGRILGAHGLRGELRVRVEGGDPASLASVRAIWVVGADAGEGASHPLVRVRDGRAGECRVQLGGIVDRDAAQALRGATLWVRSDELPSLEADEYYAYELVGCAVSDTAGTAIGEVARIVETGAQDLLVVATPEGEEHLVPATEPILHAVDLAARRVVIDPPPGLFDAPAKIS